MLCEMCGSEKNKLLLTEVDGALLKVCADCAKFGQGKKEPKPIQSLSTPVNKMPPLGAKKKAYSKDIYDNIGDDVLIDGYGKVIRQSREALHLSQEDLAKKINEKKSQIAKLESGNLIPPDNLRKKIEKALNIKLTEKYEAPTGTKHKESRPMTLQDLVKYED